MQSHFAFVPQTAIMNGPWPRVPTKPGTQSDTAPSIGARLGQCGHSAGEARPITAAGRPTRRSALGFHVGGHWSDRESRFLQDDDRAEPGEPRTAPAVRPWGTSEMRLHDPDGNVLRVNAPPATAAGSR